MRLSRYYLPLLREDPSDAFLKSHILMLRSGMMRSVGKGLYAFLPFGYSVLKKILSLISEECDAAGCMQISVPSIQPANIWIESGRYESYGKEMLRVKDRHDVEMLFGPTCEEVVTAIISKDVLLSKSLPINVYQITPKFRDEIRPRFGVMRSREFLMFDAYSFDDPNNVMNTYRMYYDIFMKIFLRLGLKALPVKADPSVIGGTISHEFQVLAESGENHISCPKSIYEKLAAGECITFDERDSATILNEGGEDATVAQGDDFMRVKGIEVGHIFSFDTKYSKPMLLKAIGSNGGDFFPHMGSYGIGVTRLIAAFIEANNDEHGIIWNDALSPFDCMLINLDAGDAACINVADDLYEALRVVCRVLYDDKEASVGQKRSAADLIGVPYQISLGKKGISRGECEIKQRSTGKKVSIPTDSLAEVVSDKKKLLQLFA